MRLIPQRVDRVGRLSNPPRRRLSPTDINDLIATPTGEAVIRWAGKAASGARLSTVADDRFVSSSPGDRRPTVQGSNCQPLKLRRQFSIIYISKSSPRADPAKLSVLHCGVVGYNDSGRPSGPTHRRKDRTRRARTSGVYLYITIAYKSDHKMLWVKSPIDFYRRLLYSAPLEVGGRSNLILMTYSPLLYCQNLPTFKTECRSGGTGRRAAFRSQ